MSPRSYATAADRWQGIGPYYAMFPTHFSDSVISAYTSPGDTVLDPFAGRGTSVFSAACQGRHGVGVEVNPVGWIFAKTKLSAASKDSVAERLRRVAEASADYSQEAERLPEFFQHCYSPGIQRFLLAARSRLDWQIDPADRTAMALLLVYLHGKRDAAFSNQMRQTKSMSPDYAVRWWQARGLRPPDIDPMEFIIKRLHWRYAKGIPETRPSEVHLGNSEQVLPALHDGPGRTRPVRLLFTSPPYYSVTNYHYDQWLRLWLLGGQGTANRKPGTADVQGKFESISRYSALIHNVFSGAAPLLDRQSTIYVRTGLGPVTFEVTLRTLQELFPRHQLQQWPRPYTRPTQTSLFGDSKQKPGEIDLILTSP